MTIPLTPKQIAQMREFQAAIQQLQQRQESYLKAILDAREDIAPDSKWQLSPDGSALLLVEPPPPAPAV